jgi:hypothetical protein
MFQIGVVEKYSCLLFFLLEGEGLARQARPIRQVTIKDARAGGATIKQLPQIEERWQEFGFTTSVRIVRHIL